MSETMQPRFYFSETEVLKRVFIVYGNLSDYYVTPSHCWFSFDRALASHLRHMGYKLVIFFDGSARMECATPEAARIRRELLPTSREQRTAPAGKAPTRKAADEPASGAAPAVMVPGGLLDDLWDSDEEEPTAASAEDAAADAAPIIFTEDAEKVPEYLDRVMRCREVKSAIVFCNSLLLLDSPERDENVSARGIARVMSRWYGIRADNENIAVMLFDMPRINTLHTALKDQRMWNFLFERTFINNNITDSVIHIGNPGLDEVQVMLTDNMPAYVSPMQLEAIDPSYTPTMLEGAAMSLVQQSNGSLKALKMFLLQHQAAMVPELLTRYGNASEDSLEKLRTTEGWEDVYQAVLHIINKVEIAGNAHESRMPPLDQRTNLRMAYPQHGTGTGVNMSMILTGNPGTGKTTVVQTIASAFKQHGLLPTDIVHKVTRADLVAKYVGQTALKTRDCIQDAMGGVLFVDEAYSLFPKNIENHTTGVDFGREALETLMEAVSNLSGEICIIMAGYPADIEHLLSANSGLPRRFSGNIVTIADYKDDLLERIFLRHLEDLNQASLHDNIPGDVIFTLSPELAGTEDGRSLAPLDMIEKDQADRKEQMLSPLSVWFANWYADRNRKTFGNADAAHRLAQQVTEHAKARTGAYDGEIAITKQDFEEELQQLFVNRKPSLKDLDNQLKDVVGMAEVKASLARVVSYLQLCKAQEALEGLGAAKAEPGHYLFVGNPGTGKTMISEQLGLALCSMGMLGKYKPIRRTGLELMNLVSTGGIERLKEEINACIGGILVVDEAHQLVEFGNAGSAVIKCLLDPMIEHRHEFSVVFCCYPEKRGDLLKGDDGLARRISDVFEFADYTPEEIGQIFSIKARKEKYIYSKGVDEALRLAYEELASLRMLENGSSAEKMLKEIKVSMGMRLRDALVEVGSSGIDADSELALALRLILPEDVQEATKRLIASMRTKIGGMPYAAGGNPATNKLPKAGKV